MRHRSSICVLLLLAACEVVSDQPKQDTATAVADTARAQGATDSVPPVGVPAVGTDSARPPADSGDVRIHPATPTRGGVIFALARGLALTQPPRCTVDGAPLPCYATSEGVAAVIPLPADEPAGARMLVIEHPTSRLTRRIEVADVDFGQELVFLDSARYALLGRQSDIARDARAIRQALSVESPERQWRGTWRDLLAAGRTSRYGVDRFYYRASDSARAVTLSPSMRTRGTFGADTRSAPARDQVPGWRHSGVDVALSRGAAVRPPAAGTVTKVGEYVLTGRTVLVDHGQGVSTAYFHLDTVLVREGERLTQQSVLGRAGSTGLTTGPHLHYGVYIHGRDVDPAAWRDMPEWMKRE